MKKIIFLFLVTALFSCVKEEKAPVKKQVISTYYLIRHAEKDRTDTTNHNPNLNEKGQKRAKKWAEVFKNVTFDKVYATKYNRTIQTATPTATAKKLEIDYYNPRKMYDSVFKNTTLGKTVLVVGHSNTTPFFANKILGNKTYKQIDDHNNANLYIVTVTNDTKTSVLLKID